MDLTEDEKLRHNVQDDADGEDVPDGRQSASQVLPPVHGMEEQSVQIRRPPGPGVGETPAEAQEDGHGRLQDEPEAPRPGEPLREVR
jgi:hypothetical protein